MEHIFAVNRAAASWMYAQVRVRQDGYGSENPWLGLVQSTHIHETRHKYFIKRHDLHLLQDPHYFRHLNQRMNIIFPQTCAQK